MPIGKSQVVHEARELLVQSLGDDASSRLGKLWADCRIVQEVVARLVVGLHGVLDKATFGREALRILDVPTSYRNTFPTWPLILADIGERAHEHARLFVTALNGAAAETDLLPHAVARAVASELEHRGIKLPGISQPPPPQPMTIFIGPVVGGPQPAGGPATPPTRPPPPPRPAQGTKKP